MEEFDDRSTTCSDTLEPGEVYDSAYEWPGENSNAEYEQELLSQNTTASSPKAKVKGNQPSFRLVVLQTSILRPKHKIAVIDAYPEVQIGRDMAPVGSDTPKIRLKEMEVSKLHATAYWDAGRREWGIVDMGSKHGTTLFSGSAPSGDNAGTRLSPPRVASIPKRLRHMDRLTIGSTTFAVHIHDSQIPCEDCSPQKGEEIPLFPVQKASESLLAKRTRDMAGLDTQSPSYTPKPDKDPKKALTMLKRSLLTRHEDPSRSSSAPSSREGSSQYVDRAARRRAFLPSSHPDAPGVSSLSSSAFTGSPSSRSEEPFVEDPVISQPPTPLPTTNIGHQLLMKQGWSPGTALGIDLDKDRTGLVEPIEINATQHRAGLGSKRPSMPSESLSSSNWKEREKHKRFEGVKMNLGK